MRVLVAPDKFAGTLSAVEAATAIATGWHRGAPHDRIRTAALSDGGPGFIDVLHAALGGELHAVTVAGPFGEPVPAAVLLHEQTAYVESAQACGLHLVPQPRRDAGEASTLGVGQLVAASIEAGARRVVVGVGGTASNDGGAGLLAGLGAQPADTLSGGGRGLAGLREVDLSAARDALAGVELVLASDVDNPLLGVRGATTVYGPQKGLRPAQVRELELTLIHYAGLVDPKLVPKQGAGAGGGLGYALIVLGATRVSGIELVLDLTGVTAGVAEADLVVTGEGSFDWQSLRGKVIAGVTARGLQHGCPVIVLAGRVDVGRREMQSLGVESAYALVDLPGGEREAFAAPAEGLSSLAERVARSWSPPREGA